MLVVTYLIMSARVTLVRYYQQIRNVKANKNYKEEEKTTNVEKVRAFYALRCIYVVRTLSNVKKHHDNSE